MSAKDIFHEAVKCGLEKDQWQISSDPLELVWKEVKVKIDLAAERLIAASGEKRKLPSKSKALSARLQLATSILRCGSSSTIKSC